VRSGYYQAQLCTHGTQRMLSQLLGAYPSPMSTTGSQPTPSLSVPGCAVAGLVLVCLV